MESQLTAQQRQLFELMSDISEECYCAGWMMGNEYTLWRMVSDPVASRDYGLSVVTDEQIAELKRLSDAVGGWIYWHDDFIAPTIPVNEWGERFIAMPEWLAMYERTMAER